MKYPFDDTDENRNPELCVPRSFSLRRKMIVAVRVRAKALGVSMSAYITALIHNDLARGLDAPLSLEPVAAEQPPRPSGVVVPGFGLED
jgi:hypothetical protein